MKARMYWIVLALACIVLISCERAGPPEPPQKLPGPQLALDPDFGNEGEVTSNLGQSEDIAAVALQDDGKIVAVGSSFREDTQSSDLVLARYLPSGELDTSFGADGYVFTPAGSADTEPNQGSFKVVALQDDGKILAAGYAALSIDEHYTPGMILVRYNPDGSLDTGFGKGGIAREDAGEIGGITALELQADGRIIVVGDGWSTDEVAVVRFTSSGQSDSSFGAGGRFATPYRPTAVSGSPKLLQRGDSSFVLALDTRLIGLSAEGMLDESFGESGEVDTGYAIQELAQQDDGSIIVGQDSEPNYSGLHAQTSPIEPTDFRLMRYTLEGEQDTSFGEAGIVVTDINSNEEIWSLALQNDGKIVAAGRTQDAVAVVRYTPSGEVDASFVGAFNGADALALDDQNRIVVGGARLEGDSYDFVLARFLP